MLTVLFLLFRSVSGVSDYLLFRLCTHQGRGMITTQDATALFRQVVPNMPEHVIETIFREMDTSLAGQVTYQEFARLLRSGDATEHKVTTQQSQPQ